MLLDAFSIFVLMSTPGPRPYFKRLWKCPAGPEEGWEPVVADLLRFDANLAYEVCFNLHASSCSTAPPHALLFVTTSTDCDATTNYKNDTGESAARMKNGLRTF